MADAWIYSDDAEEASTAARLLAELGFSPRRGDLNGSLRPAVDQADGTRQPSLALVIESGEESCAGVCARLRADEELTDVPVLLALGPDRLEETDTMLDADELILLPLHPGELRARIARARRRAHGVDDDDVVRLGALELNVATYQVRIDGQPVDFTYMEYELLKFLVTHPGRVFSREALLSRVWGYDYYGGARTVDVHVRRVRAKLGQEHAARIKTVRSVGYRFDV